MKTSTYEKLAIISIIIGVVIIVITSLSFLSNQYIDVDSAVNDKIFGNYGSFLGGTVGILWALAGVFLFFAALKSQRKDFENQIGEVQQQNRTLLIQNFENNFYNIIKFKFDHLNSIHRYQANKDTSTPINGWIVIRQFGSYLTNQYSIPNELSNTNDVEPIYKNFRDFYSARYKQDPDYSFLRSFFSYVYILISSIESNEYLTEIEKNKYVDILRSQLSQDELIIIFYHCIYGFDHKKLVGLVKKYFLLQSLYENKVFHFFRSYLIGNFKSLDVEKI